VAPAWTLKAKSPVQGYNNTFSLTFRAVIIQVRTISVAKGKPRGLMNRHLINRLHGYYNNLMTSAEQSTTGASSLPRNVMTLVTGTVLSQIITILSSPIITRLYGPEAFGLLAVFTTITGIFGTVICLRYELAIMLPDSDEEAANVFGLCMIFVLLISLLSVPLLILSQQFLVQILNVPALGPYFLFIPMSLFLTGAFFALNYWNTRTKQFKRLAIARVMSSSSVTGTQLGMGSIGYASGGVLIGATIIGQLVSTFVLTFQIMKDHTHFFKKNITLDGMVAVLKRFSNFPKYDLWSALLCSISGSLPVFIFSIYFNSTVLGYYSLALMVLMLPMSLIGSAIGQVFFQKAAEAKNISQTKLTESVETILKPLIVLSVFPTIILALIGPEIFGIIFGVKWLEAGNYVRYLSFWICIVFIYAPLCTLINIFLKQKINLFFNTLDLICRSVALIIGALMGDVLVAIILFSAAGVIVNLIPFIYIHKLADVSLGKTAKIFSKYIVLSIPFIIIIVFVQKILLINNIVLLIFSGICTLLYYLLAVWNDPDLIEPLKNIASQIPILKKYFN
jgi:lipopolysaccharide exporter